MGRGRPPRHDWDLWLDGQRHLLISNRDFPGVAVRSMRQQILNEATKRGIKVATRIKENPLGDGVDYIDVRSRAVDAPKKVDWDKVLQRLPRKLVQGRDFDCEVESMRVRVYQAAQRRDIAVTTEISSGSIVVRAKRVPNDAR